MAGSGRLDDPHAKVSSPVQRCVHVLCRVRALPWAGVRFGRGGRRGTAAERPAPDLILDDLNQELGSYGNDTVESPEIDRLTERGIRFTHAYAQWPSCLPSRMSFLSGWSPVRTEVVDFSARSRTGPLADAVYLPQHFRNHGYVTARLDKVFHIGADDPASWTISEEPYRDEAGRFRHIWTGRELEALGLEDRVVRSGRYPEVRVESGTYAVMEASVDDGDLFDGRNAARAVELLEQFAKGEEPFFLAVGLRRPHLPWIVPERYFEMYPPEPGKIPLPPPQPGLEDPLDPQIHREMRAHYYAATTFADTQAGKVLSALERLGLDANTIVVLMGDHGYHLGERDNFYAKGNLWERSLRTALIVALPGNTRGGAVCDRPIGLIDLYPTLVDLCGLPRPPVPLDGESFRVLLEDPEPAWRDAVVSYRNNKALGALEATVRTRRYRYTEGADGKPQTLIDYAEDPYEWRNRVADPSYAALRETLRGRLAEERVRLEE